MAVLLEVRDLETRFRLRKGYVYAVNGVSFQLEEGETLGVVGESGCGKSVTMLSILQLLPPAGRIEKGEVLFEGRDLLKMDGRELRKVRGAKISMVFQDPMTSLTPVVRIGTQIAEPLVYHRGMSMSQARRQSVELLDMVGIPDPETRLREYPYQLSGGMRQRAMIAMALACQPRVLIADEPTTALDVTVQAQIVELVKRLRDEIQAGIVWITHDLGVIAGLADRVMVMYAGSVVEEATVDDLYEDPRHPYTEALLGALPSVSETAGRRLTSIGGAPPDLVVYPAFCPFFPRCEYAMGRCQEQKPTLTPASEARDPRHRIACWVDIQERRRA
ncbi:MAG: ABC transporter ATP-binding protein [Chloroflexi bacterium]|nr:ABC transporter ATP-binding protein [Chloroflexota bacterium]